VLIRTTPAVADSVDITFLDSHGADLSAAAQRKLERVFTRQEYRRAFPGEIGDLEFRARVTETYAVDLVRNVDITGVRESGLKVVVDTGGGTASLVLPALLGRLGVDVLAYNTGIDEASPTETASEKREAMRRLAELVGSSHAAFGVHFDPVGERISLVDDKGRVIDDERALLVVVDLVVAERRGRVALPVTTTRVAEAVARYHGVSIEWTTTSPDDLTRAAGAGDLILAGDGRGGFVVPEFSTSIDGIAAFVRLVGLVARTQLHLSEIDARIPQSHLVRRAVPTPWAAKGSVMRGVVEAAGDIEVDTTDGVRVVRGDRLWALVLPDPAEPVTHVWAEGPDAAAAAELLDHWCKVVDAAAH
jgi:mannose-1-phosphate guanylyltransferase/phosphomannomutase